jgi:cephalosporin hydroxylase
MYPKMISLTGSASVVRKKAAEAKRLAESAFRWLAWVPFRTPSSSRTIRRFRRLSEQARTVEQAVDLAASFSSLKVAIAPVQVRDEIVGLLNMLEAVRPHTVLEIGTAKGGTLFLFTRVAHEDALVVSVDMPHGEFGGGYPRYMVPLLESFARPGQRIHLVEGDSHKEETLNEILRILGGRKVDFLFIDGDHNYEGVKRDFEMYSPLVSKGGMIAFHDIVSGPAIHVGGVPRFWGEVKATRDHKEFVRDKDQGGFGIGVLFL